MSRLQVGGALRADAAYVERAADSELHQALLGAELCYVLAPRQMGKSSLMVRTALRLREGGVAVAIVDLTALGTDLDPRSWTLGLCDELANEWGTEAPDAWFERDQPPVQQLVRYLAEAVLPLGGARVVFIDEIDAMLSLPFGRDDFFGAIRALWNRRATEPEWAALTFCLVGAAPPWELASDPRRTPFNVGRDVRLRDFELAELEPVRAELSDPGLLDAVFAWTRGHPYMTMRLLAWVAERGGSVDEAVAECFLARGARGDVTLASSERLILAGGARLLGLYRTALRSGSAQAGPRELREAVMTGLLAERGDGRLAVRNRIVEAVFDADWAARVAGGRVHREALERWIRGGRQDADLVRGQALQELIRWAEGREDLDADETAFVLASTEAERAREGERARQRLQRVGVASLAVVVAVLLAALGATGWALGEQRVATERAEALRRAAQIELLASVPGRQLDALEQAVREVRRDPIPEATMALSAAVNAARGAVIRLEQPVLAVACEPEVTAWTEAGAHRVDFRSGGVERIERPIPPPRERAGLRVVPVPDRPYAVLVDDEGEELRRLTGGHDEEVTAWDLQGNRVVTGADDDSAVLWELSTGEVLGRFPLIHGAIRDVAICADGQRAILAGEDGSVGLFLLLGGAVERALPRSDLTAADIAPSGELVTVATDGDAELWAEGGPRILSEGHTGDASAQVDREGRAVVTDGSYVAAIATPDGAIARVPGWGLRRMPRFDPAGRIVLLREAVVALLGEPELSLVGPREQVTWAEGSPDGQWFATGSFDGGVRLYDAHTGELRAELGRMERAVLGLEWSSAGDLAAYGQGGVVGIWRPPEAAPVGWIEAHRGKVADLAWSPDGERLATAGFTENTVRLWTSRGDRITDLGHLKRPRFVAFAPDGSRLATAGDDGVLRLWDGRTGAPLAAFDGHVGLIRALRFSPDGARVMTLADDGRVRLFPARTEALVERACGWLALAGRPC